MDYLYFSPTTYVLYSFFCMLTYHVFINIRCKHLIKADPELNKKYAPFARDDIMNWGFIRMFPWYFWFWPKIIITLPIIFLTGLYYSILMWGHP
jgi:hypothetical protein